MFSLYFSQNNSCSISKRSLIENFLSLIEENLYAIEFFFLSKDIIKNNCDEIMQDILESHAISRIIISEIKDSILIGNWSESIERKIKNLIYLGKNEKCDKLLMRRARFFLSKNELENVGLSYILKMTSKKPFDQDLFHRHSASPLITDEIKSWEADGGRVIDGR